MYILLSPRKYSLSKIESNLVVVLDRLFLSLAIHGALPYAIVLITRFDSRATATSLNIRNSTKISRYDKRNSS